MGNIKNGELWLEDARMEYIRFGRGKRTLVMIPGLGDSLRSMKGAALPMAVLYQIFARDFTVYIFSRKNPLPVGSTTRDMADDQAKAMEMLGIEKADIFGVSMGGMIAQHLAADHPRKVNKLVLAVTCARENPVLTEAVGEWIGYAERKDHAGFMDSNLRRIYSETYYRKNKWMVPVLGKLTCPKSYEGFFRQAEACLTHDAYEKLPRILAPTLVIGGEKDMALSGEASKEIAGRIPGAELQMYAQWGHGLYEEERGFNRRILGFLLK